MVSLIFRVTQRAVATVTNTFFTQIQYNKHTYQLVLLAHRRIGLYVRPHDNRERPFWHTLQKCSEATRYLHYSILSIQAALCLCLDRVPTPPLCSDLAWRVEKSMQSLYCTYSKCRTRGGALGISPGLLCIYVEMINFHFKVFIQKIRDFLQYEGGGIRLNSAATECELYLCWVTLKKQAP